MGTKALGKKLNVLLISHIKRCLPHIKDKISNLLCEKRLELEGYGGDLEFEGPKGAKSVMLMIVTKFMKLFCDYLEGKFVKESTEVLKGGSRIHFIFHETLFKTIE